MIQLVAIGAGGAIGAIARFWLSHRVFDLMGRGFPWGTLAVNFTGSFLIGVLFIAFQNKFPVHDAVRAGLMLGVLGGFTTFSTFSIETVNLLLEGSWFRASAYIVSSVGLCVAGTLLGITITR